MLGKKKDSFGVTLLKSMFIAAAVAASSAGGAYATVALLGRAFTNKPAEKKTPAPAAE